MKVMIGSNNPAKINAVQTVFPTFHVQAVNASSCVSAQPFSDGETREGAIHRALECVHYQPDSIGIGLECGVMYVEDRLYLCNWGALSDGKNNTYTASGARIPLPEKVHQELFKGHELGEVMNWYTGKQETRKNEGAVGIFTNGLITRQEMFVHVVALLHGQWTWNQEN